MDTKEFDERNAEKSRSVCERIEREDAGRDYKTEASYLRSKLNAAEDKAERRLHHARYLESVIRDRNAKLKERKQRIHELTNEVGRLGKQVSDLAAELEDTNRMLREADQLSERERQILDMWPRFEDGEYVWFGDDVSEIDARSFVFVENGAMVTNLTSVPAYGAFRRYGWPFKRPAPKALDADGVEIKVGDTVWTLNGLEGVVTKVEDGAAYIAYESDYAQREESANLTHENPAPKDSWEQLVEDARMEPCDYFNSYPDDDRGCTDCAHRDSKLECDEHKALDLVRRAKALAGVEG